MFQHYLATTKSLANLNRKEIFPTFYAKSKNEDKYNKKASLMRKRNLHHLMSGSHSSQFRSVTNLNKCNNIESLVTMSIANRPKRNFGIIANDSKSGLSYNASGRSIKTKPGEINRVIWSSTSNLEYKKLSHIVNYNLADNTVLQKQIKNLTMFSRNLKNNN